MQIHTYVHDTHDFDHDMTVVHGIIVITFLTHIAYLLRLVVISKRSGDVDSFDKSVVPITVVDDIRSDRCQQNVPPNAFRDDNHDDRFS